MLRLLPSSGLSSGLSCAALLTLVFSAGCGDRATRSSIDPPEFVLAWGDSGSAEGQFDEPKGVAVDATGNVYVADANNHRIQKFDPEGRFLLQWGAEGSAEGQFENPWAVAIDAAGHVYVTDRNNHRIQEFDASGRFIRAWGGWGLSNGLFSHPRGIAVGPGGEIFVVEGYVPSDRNRVQVFDARGRYLRSWGSYGQRLGQFDFTAGPEEEAPGTLLRPETAPLGHGGRCGGIRGVAVDRSGTAYVADLGNNRVQVFNHAGALRDAWGHHGYGPGEFEFPQGIAVDADGRVYVNDGGPDRRIQVFSASGDFLTQWGSSGSGNGEFSLQPVGIAVDGDGNIYVADTGNFRVQKFRLSPGSRVASPAPAVTRPR